MKKIDYKALSPEMTNLLAFTQVIVAIVILAKVGTGAPGVDLSIMTALVAVAGSLANNFRKSQPVGVEQAETVNQNGGNNAEVD